MQATRATRNSRKKSKCQTRMLSAMSNLTTLPLSSARQQSLKTVARKTRWKTRALLGLTPKPRWPRQHSPSQQPLHRMLQSQA